MEAINFGYFFIVNFGKKTAKFSNSRLKSDHEVKNHKFLTLMSSKGNHNIYLKIHYSAETNSRSEKKCLLRA